MFPVIISLAILSSVLLILVILAQNSKGGGLSSQFGGSATSNIIGVKKTTDLLEKITWGLAIALLALSLSTNFLIGNEPGQTGPTVDPVEAGQSDQVVPPVDLLEGLQDDSEGSSSSEEDESGE